MKACLWLVFAVAALSFEASGAIITMANCSIAGVGSQSGASTCQVTSPGEFASGASISGTETLPPLGSPSSPTSVSFNINTGNGGRVILNSDANVSGSDDLVLYTAGPARPGEVVLAENIGIDGIASNLSTDLVLGSLTSTCTQFAPAAPMCSGNIGLPNGNGTFSAPFTLGEPFAFSVNVFDDSAGGGPIPHFGIGTQAFSFQLFEADGTTPFRFSRPSLPALASSLLGYRR